MATNHQTPQGNSALNVVAQQAVACRLCLDAGYFVEAFPIWRGDALYPVTFIGQAPGNIERARPVSFGGQAGRRLFQWLAQIGLSETTARHFFYFSSLTKCYPGKAAKGQGDRKPSPVEVSLCRSFMQREVEIIRPRIIIPIGGMAIAPLYPQARLDQIIGTSWTSDLASIAAAYRFTAGSSLYRTDEQKVKIIPLPHPSGASHWLNAPANQALVNVALEHLRDELVALGVPFDNI